MNKLETNYDGGMPFDLDDIRFIQDAWRQAFGAFNFIRKQDNTTIINNIILNPYNLVGTFPGPYTTTENFILHDKEIWWMPSQAVASLSNDTWFVFSETNDTAGSDIFEDTVTHETYKVRQVSIVINATQPANSIRFSDVVELRNVNKDFGDELITLSTVTYPGGSTWVNLTNVKTPYIKIRSISAVNYYIQTITNPGYLKELYIEFTYANTGQSIFIVQNNANNATNFKLNRTDAYVQTDTVVPTSTSSQMLGLDHTNAVFSTDKNSLLVRFVWDGSFWRQTSESSLLWATSS
jgi:hypothetical protein